MKAITGINHIGLRVTDLSTARAFYEKLGFEFIYGPAGPEPIAVMIHPSGINLNLILNGVSSMKDNILMDVPEKYAGYTHVALEINDAQAVQKSLESQGIEITEGPVNFPGGTSLFIRDQDRNVIEFYKVSKE